jgi:Xaa-Pro dipeptidase
MPHPRSSFDSELYFYAQSLEDSYGWEFGGSIAGHLIGQFPHGKIEEDKLTLHVDPESHFHLRMRSLDENGRNRRWILEIHFVDKELKIGGFYEELLTWNILMARTGNTVLEIAQ